MDFFTHIDIPHPQKQFSYADIFLLLGSCFAMNIGNSLKENKFNADVNPFGILYNPLSISKALQILLEGKKFQASDLFFHNGQWNSRMHHGAFSATSEEECLKQINTRLTISEERLKRVTCMIVTWGTAYVYRLHSTGEVVANCHKVPERYFLRERLSPDDIAKEWIPLLEKLFNLCPSLNIILTVSPIRHWKDGAHGNQLSKATLLLAADRIQEYYPERVSYFPAYEIMMDELREYRFYSEDMLHPSAQAVSYIWNAFCKNYLTPETLQAMKNWEEIVRALNHRPLHPESDAYQNFINQTMLKWKRLIDKFPYFGDEIDALKVSH